MNIIPYQPEWFPKVLSFAKAESKNTGLLHQPFVDYYYSNNDWCNLFMLVDGKDRLVGTIGVERMPFFYRGRYETLGFGSNYFVSQKGVGHGDILFRKWIETSGFGIAFGSSADAHRIYRKYGWKYYDGIKVYSLNEPLTPYPGEPMWRVAAKSVISKLPRPSIQSRLMRVKANISEKILLLEERSYEKDLWPKNSPFQFRFIPSEDYLNWRYRTDLPFVRYRAFRIINDSGETEGFIVLNQAKNRVIVSHCDGNDPSVLAYSVLMSLGKIAPDFKEDPEVWLASCHPVMQSIYKGFGFKMASPDRPFAIGSLNRHSGIEGATVDWLVNLDWGDNGLRVPFTDQL